MWQLFYSADTKPALVSVCHCRDCQHQTGSAFGTFVIIPSDAFQMEGDWRTYEQAGGSGDAVLRHFCPNCGSPVAIGLIKEPDNVLLTAETPDDIAFVEPTRNIYCDLTQSWVPMKQEARNFARGPS